MAVGVAPGLTAEGVPTDGLAAEGLLGADGPVTDGAGPALGLGADGVTADGAAAPGLVDVEGVPEGPAAVGVAAAGPLGEPPQS